MSEIVPVTSANLDEVVFKSDIPVILAIGASWCIDCRRAAPFYQAFAKEYAGRMKFVAIDSEVSPELKEKFDVKHIPTMLVVKNGVELPGRLVEVKTPSELKAFIEQGLAA